MRHYILRHPPVNNQRSVALFLQRGYFDRFVAKLTGIYQQRCEVMHASLERHFPGASVKPEYGGAIIWLRLPDGADAEVLRKRVEPEGVYFETGGFTFADERRHRNHIRLGYSVIEKSSIPDGIDIIAKCVPRRGSRSAGALTPDTGAPAAGARPSRRRLPERHAASAPAHRGGPDA